MESVDAGKRAVGEEKTRRKGAQRRKIKADRLAIQGKRLKHTNNTSAIANHFPNLSNSLQVNFRQPADCTPLHSDWTVGLAELSRTYL